MLQLRRRAAKRLCVEARSFASVCTPRLAQVLVIAPCTAAVCLNGEHCKSHSTFYWFIVLHGVCVVLL